MDWRLLVKEHIANIEIPLYLFLFVVLPIFAFRIFWICECLLTSILCIMVELAGGGSVPVPVGVSDW